MVLGLHHVTAIAADAQRNLSFYAGVLGLRFVKRTVDFDDPRTYHTYFGDELGRPGSVLSFFSWPGMQRGQLGTGQAGVISFSISLGSTAYWIERLVGLGVAFTGPLSRFGERYLAFRDTDGLLLELVARPDATRREGWHGGPVPPEHAIRGLHGVTLWVADRGLTGMFLSHELGMQPVAEEGNVTRYAAGAGGPGCFVDLRGTPEFWSGKLGTGTVHHVALRAGTLEAQDRLREAVAAAGFTPTLRIDRKYFSSVSFREPGGVMIELSTDGPGFLLDEPLGRLGERLMLPERFEPMRESIERDLPPVRLPDRARSRARR
ncbi:MAG: VOC family protein [Vicinamibacterales bacterium]